MTMSPADWDHTSRPEFFNYYARESASPQARDRFSAIRETILRVDRRRHAERSYDVLDVGCGAGAQASLWAEAGCRVHGLDINAPLIALARERSAAAGQNIDFRVGSALSLPWPDESMDVCLAAELLEHVTDWEGCLREFTRVLRPHGILFLTTTNKLCPRQQEFNLPVYSWYPRRVKRYFEQLAVTTHPRLANYATYPAVNWFTFYELRRWLDRAGFDSLDRFDVSGAGDKSLVRAFILSVIRALPPLRWLAHVATPGTGVVAVKRSSGRDIVTVSGAR
jgi:2-polyprenyl-6-hydroxyphenyl methylase/3-demethylubiquinone-9 3-methyltransferase